GIAGTPAAVKSVDDTVTVHSAGLAPRESVTVIVPSDPEMVVPGSPAPMEAAAGTVTDSGPAVTANVTTVSCAFAGWTWNAAAHAVPAMSRVSRRICSSFSRPMRGREVPGDRGSPPRPVIGFGGYSPACGYPG